MDLGEQDFREKRHSEVIRLSRTQLFTPSHMVPSFNGYGLWLVNSNRGIKDLKSRRTVTKEGYGARPPLAHSSWQLFKIGTCGT